MHYGLKTMAATSVAALALMVHPSLAGGCVEDLDGSSEVGFADLLQLLAAWGPCGGCPEDLDGSGDVGFADLLQLLAAWGPCPGDGEIISTQLAGNSLGSYPFFEYVLAFNEGEGFEVAVDPGQHPQIVGETGDIYVVEAKTAAEWGSDPSLSDETGGSQSAAFVAGTIQANTFAISGSAALDGGAGPRLGVAYDVVIDFNENGILDGGDFIDTLDGAEGAVPVHGAYVVHDTTDLGPYPVTELTYNISAALLCSSLVGENLFYPTNIGSLGELPLIIISHGNGHNYQWYDHIGEHMASYGYVVMSHANNTGPGVAWAAISQLQHINAFIGLIPTIAGGALNGHVDTDNMIWIGHSRGAECIAISYDSLFDGSIIPVGAPCPTSVAPVGWSIDDVQLLSSIAPTDFLTSPNTHPHNANYHLWTGSGDADVNGCASCNLCQTFHLHDRATDYRQSTTLQGVGHAWFHNGGGPSVFSGPCPLGVVDTHLVELGYLYPLAERYIFGNVPAKDFLWRQYESFHPIGAPVGNPCLVVNNMYRDSPDAGNFMIDDFQTQASTATSSSGGPVTNTVTSLAEGLLDDANGDFTTGIGDTFNGMTAGGPGDTTRGCVFQWLGNSFIEFGIIAAQMDFTDNNYLSFRACQETRHGLTIGTLGDSTFDVTLEDGSGNTSTINIGAYGGGIEEPFQRTTCGAGTGWANEFEIIRIRLADFLNNGSDVDLSDIAAVRFEFGPAHGSSVGRLGLDEVEVTAD